MVRGFVLGVIATLAVLIAASVIAVLAGLVPANADGKPSALERWAAHHSLDATVSREATTDPNPEALNDANLLAGIKLYGENCSACHGVANGLASNITVGLYQHAPLFGRRASVDDPAGETYWKIEHGIRWTAMPSFATTLTTEQMWQLALFLKNMDALTPAAGKAWHALKEPVAIAPSSAQPPRRRPTQ